MLEWAVGSLQLIWMTLFGWLTARQNALDEALRQMPGHNHDDIAAGEDRLRAEFSAFRERAEERHEAIQRDFRAVFNKQDAQMLEERLTRLILSGRT